MVVATPPTESSSRQLSELAWWTRPVATEARLQALLAEIRSYQRRLPNGEEKLMEHWARRDSGYWQQRKRDWDRLLGAYRWAVAELREQYGLPEPEMT